MASPPGGDARTSMRSPASQPHADAPGEGFRPEHRLLQRRLFVEAYERGMRAHGRLTVLFALRREDDGPWRLGLTATRKLGGAVVRNRLRRQGREIFRHWGDRIPNGWDFVLNFKHGAFSASQAFLRTDLANCLARLGIGLADPADPPQASENKVGS
jgi:ribonuclease P protein component